MTNGAGGGIEMRERPTDEKDFPEYIQYLIDVAEPRTQEEREADLKVIERYKDAAVLDPLFVGGPGFPAGFTTEQYEAATQHLVDHAFTMTSATISNGSDGSVEEIQERMQSVNDHWDARSEKYLRVRTVDDIRTAKETGRFGINHNFQSMNGFGGDIASIEPYYELGLRQANFTYNVDNAYSSGCDSNGKNDRGLTDLGRDAIREMNRVGVVVDGSHSSDRTAIEAAVLSTQPVILSHSNSATLHPIARNSSDEAIQAVGATGGVICVNFLGGFLNSYGDARPYSIAKHIQYIRNLAGPEAVGAASDYVWNYAETLDWVLRNPVQFPPDMGYATPSHMGKPGEIWGVVSVLEDTYGWTNSEIRGLLGENVLRVYEANWK